jgi:hypothetical protein
VPSENLTVNPESYAGATSVSTVESTDVEFLVDALEGDRLGIRIRPVRGDRCQSGCGRRFHCGRLDAAIRTQSRYFGVART